MNVVDSSGWLEFFLDGPNAPFFADALENTENLVVPTVSIYEVFKRVAQQCGEDEALHKVAAMHQATVADLTTPIALDAARLSLQLCLPMADCLILATAHAFGATLWTQDSDFDGVDGVKYQPRRSAKPTE